jgi:alkanesulfonate monooxygenase SsuD/methylene tetrahydromethanopterin reductase-like flavin-dependent oxidoreductase (luciferase family)
MRFSIFQLPASIAPESDRSTIETMVEQALYADQAGFSGIFGAEHHATGLSPVGSDSMMYAAHLAPQLTQAHLGLSLVVVPYHHPLRFVERVNLLDQLARGRVLIGLGSGNRDVQECLAMGIDMNDAATTMLDEHLELAERLWGKRIEDEPLAFETKYYRGTVVERVVPAPYRHRPQFMGVAMRDASIERAAAQGWPVFVFGGGPDARRRLRLYREHLSAAGHTPEVLAHCMGWTTHTFVSAVVADTDEQAYDAMKANIALEGQRRARSAGFQQTARELMHVPPPARVDFGDLTDPERPEYLYGSPDTVAAKLAPYVELGFGNILLCFDGSFASAERRKVTDRSMRLFAEEVLPRFTGVATPTDPLTIPLDAISPPGLQPVGIPQ